MQGVFQGAVVHGVVLFVDLDDVGAVGESKEDLFVLFEEDFEVGEGV